MRIFLTLFRRELSAFFLSVTGYVIIAAATFMIGESFCSLIAELGNESSTMPITEIFYNTYYFWIIVLLAAPIITMRLFALEKASGTFETLMTTAVTDTQVVAAKFGAALFFFMVMWLPLLAALFVIRHFTGQASALDQGTIGGTFLGIFLIGCLFLSLGCFASALSRSQMAAAMISFVLGASLFSLGFLAQVITVTSEWQTQVISYFNLFGQMDDFARGVVDTRALIFYTSATLLFLFLTLRIMESRRWK